MTLVHTPYAKCAVGDSGGNAFATPVVSQFECVPSVRRWWQMYLRSDDDTHRGVGAWTPHSGRPMPTAIQAVCQELLHHTVSVFGSHRGSLSSEALQNIVMRTQSILYELVVGHVFRFRWHAFLNYHWDTLQLVSTAKNTTEKCWRVFQCRDRDEWEQVDAARSHSLRVMETEICDTITQLLQECPDRECNVSTLLCHILPLLDRSWRPCRIVEKMVGHHPQTFESKKTDNGALILCLRQPPDVDHEEVENMSI